MTPQAPVDTLASVPNQPKTPIHCIRCPDELWSAAQQKATAEGRNITSVLRSFLEEYVSPEQYEIRRQQ